MASFTNKTPEALLALGTNVATVIGPGTTNPYGVPTAAVTALMAADAALGGAINAQVAAKAAEKAATVTKAAKRDGVVAALNTIATAVYANPAVTDTMLASLGFPARRSGPAPRRVPTEPTGLSAEPFANGTVKLKWNRNGNKPGILFVIETSEDGLAWTMIRSTTRSSFAVEGFAPGVPAWFRITATTSTAASLPRSPSPPTPPLPPPPGFSFGSLRSLPAAANHRRRSLTHLPRPQTLPLRLPHRLLPPHPLRHDPLPRRRRPEVQTLDPQPLQNARSIGRRIGPVEPHRLGQIDRRVRDDADQAPRILRRRVEHERMEQEHVPRLPRRLLELAALAHERAEVELRGQDALRPIREEPGDDGDRVGGDVGRPALVLDVRPVDEDEQPLLGRVEEVPEKVAVLVPPGRLRPGGRAKARRPRSRG